jgi:hypothetical protein
LRFIQRTNSTRTIIQTNPKQFFLKKKEKTLSCPCFTEPRSLLSDQSLITHCNSKSRHCVEELQEEGAFKEQSGCTVQTVPPTVPTERAQRKVLLIQHRLPGRSVGQGRGRSRGRRTEPQSWRGSCRAWASPTSAASRCTGLR